MADGTRRNSRSGRTRRYRTSLGQNIGTTPDLNQDWVRQAIEDGMMLVGAREIAEDAAYRRNRNAGERFRRAEQRASSARRRSASSSGGAKKSSSKKSTSSSKKRTPAKRPSTAKRASAKRPVKKSSTTRRRNVR